MTYGDADDPRSLLDLVGERDDVLHGRDERALFRRADEHRYLRERRDWLVPPLHRAGDDLRRLHSALEGVHVRVGVVAHQSVGVAHHRGRDVGVQVQRADDRHVRSDHVADPRQQVALGVLQLLGDHRSVQVQQHSVDGQCALQALDQQRRKLVPRVLSDDTRRLRKGPDQWHQFHPEVLGGGDESAGADACLSEGLDDLVTPAETGVATLVQEMLDGGGAVGECVGFVRYPACCDAHLSPPMEYGVW